jgi:hypothetical protein
MALPTGPVAVGATDTYTATALGANGNVVADAVVSTVSSDDTIVSLVSNGSTGGVETGTWTAVADGTATFTSTSGSVSTGPGNPYVFTVAAPVDQVTQVSLA